MKLCSSGWSYGVAQDFNFPITDHVNFGHWMKAVPASFLHSKVTRFPVAIAIVTSFSERFLETM